VGATLGFWLLVALTEWIIRRKTRRGDKNNVYWFAVALVGILVSAISFSTQWADKNAFIPGLFFPAVFFAIACGDLTNSQKGGWRRWASGPLSILLGGAIAVQLSWQLYSPEKFLPAIEDRLAGKLLIDDLRRIKGPVLVPYHPYYPRLAGKQTNYHQMGTNDVTRAGFPFPYDIVDRISEKYYGAILLDKSPEGHYHSALKQYKFSRYFQPSEVPKTIAGYFVRPRYLLVLKKSSSPLPTCARRVFDFEDGTFKGWQIKGSGFGTKPRGGTASDQLMAGPFEGSYLVGSHTLGDMAVGSMLSPEFLVDKPTLTYRMGGGRYPKLIQVRLLVADKEVHRSTGTNSHIMEIRKLDVRAYIGKMMRVELIDNATGPWGYLLFDDLVLTQCPTQHYPASNDR
ncbi:MAG: hypothetical protein V1754_11365, partial [Pseudomonadota bacterium]